MQLKHTFNSPKIAQLLLQGNETHLSIAVVLVPSLPSGGSRPEAAAHYSSGNKNAPYSGQVATIKFCDDKQTNKEND
jgi:hypothetical protein